ncbi:MAG: type II toxin-antitoxin system ParD family antitoxin [Chloroflexia bacterium]|nr:type II toxin-antitoxin system ParD family antitoxin [Chloroflexia bacterium]
MSMTITLPDHIQSWIDRQVAEGRYDTTDAVIANAVEQAMGGYRWEEDEDLLEAIAQADRGEVFEWTPQLRADIRRQSEENLKRGHVVSDDIKY